MSKCQKNDRRTKDTVKSPVLQAQSIATIDIKGKIAKKGIL
jgi:hypothetical protein